MSRYVGISKSRHPLHKLGRLITADDLEHYMHERGRRGSKLPRGLQKVDAIYVGEREGAK